MFCEKCGKENPDGAKFCEGCGSELSQNIVSDEADVNLSTEYSTEASGVESANADFSSDTQPEEPKKKSSKSIIAAAIVAVVVIVALVFGIKAVFGGGPESVVKNYVKAMETGKASYMLKTIPKSMEKEIKKDDDKMDELEDNMKDSKESIEDQFGDKAKITYKILDKEKIDKDDLEDLEDSFNDNIKNYNDENDTNIKKVKISKGYEMNVKIKIKGEDDSDSHTTTMTVVKIDGRWCTDESLHALF